jgi:hypothetical protein
MRVASTWSDGAVSMRFRLDHSDTTEGKGQGDAPITLITGGTTHKHPQLHDDLHPDLLALAILTIAVPWVGSQLKVEKGVTSHFAETVQRAFGIALGPIDPFLTPRQIDGEIGLLFSGGVDSTAMMTFLPDSSPLIHHRRVRHPRIPNRATHLRSDVAEETARSIAGESRNLEILRTDLEFMCGPFPTFPSWAAIAVGSILLADVLALSGVSTGTILGSRFMDGQLYHPGGDRDLQWRETFAAAGLPFYRGMTGATELATYKFTDEAGLAGMTRTCQLGSAYGPCNRCMGCLRRVLIEAVVHDEPVDAAAVASLATNDYIIRNYTGPPPYMLQPTLMYTLSRARGIDGTFLETTRDQLECSDGPVNDFVERYYTPALDDLSDPWRAEFEEALFARIDPMTEADRHIVERWRQGESDRRSWRP